MKVRSSNRTTTTPSEAGSTLRIRPTTRPTPLQRQGAADVRELKPNNKRAIKAGEKQVKNYVNELKELYPDKKWEWHIDTYDK